MNIVGIFCGLVLFCLGSIQCAPQKDLVKKIPGLSEQPAFKMYSGYLEATGTRKFHYWFVESQSNPSKDPLVLWLNGGPGCSSMLGILTENGPFTVQLDGHTLKPNPSSWNLVANVLYLESPAGVGYSYANNTNYHSGDKQVAISNYEAIKSFFKLYPEYSATKFFLTGESYAGFYIPTLAVKIVNNTKINLVGLLIGNGISNKDMNDNSATFFLYYHGLIGPKQWDHLLDVCCHGKERDCNFAARARTNPMCRHLYDAASYPHPPLHIDYYNILSPCYVEPTSKPQGRKTFIPRWLYRENTLLHPELEGNQKDSTPLHSKYSPPLHYKYSKDCTNDFSITNYMNLKAVRKALHIPPHLPRWLICNFTLHNFHWNYYYTNVKSFYEQLLNSKSLRKLRITKYNGDIDSVVNFLGDQQFVEELNATLHAERRTWLVKDAAGHEQIAGFVTEYEGISFVTVKGAGHMVPLDKPVQALEMFKRFLRNVPY